VRLQTGAANAALNDTFDLAKRMIGYEISVAILSRCYVRRQTHSEQIDWELHRL
jgi:hypothetical protein